MPTSEVRSPGRAIGRRAFLAGVVATAVAAGCSGGDGDDAAPADDRGRARHRGRGGRPAAGAAQPARRAVPPGRGVGRPSPRRRHPLDPARQRSARRRRRPARPAAAGAVGGGDRATTFDDIVASGDAVAEPALGPLGARRRLGPRARHLVPLPLLGRDVDQPGGAHPHRPAAAPRSTACGSPSPRARIPGGLLAGPHAPGGRGRRPRGVPRRLHLRERAEPGRGPPAADARRRSTWPATAAGTASTRPTRPCRPRTPRAPWVCTWDDHEVANNYAGDVPGGRDWAGRDVFPARRAAAYQAWYEHMPLRLHPPDGGLTVYRTVAWGGLARFHVLDGRQYRSDQPCATSDVGWPAPRWATTPAPCSGPSRSVAGRRSDTARTGTCSPSRRRVPDHGAAGGRPRG